MIELKELSESKCGPFATLATLGWNTRNNDLPLYSIENKKEEKPNN